MPDAAADLGVLVAWLRALHGWSQAELAAQAGINPATVSLYESADMTPSESAIDKLAGAAGLPRWLLDGVLLPAVALAREVAAAGSAPEAGRDLAAEPARPEEDAPGVAGRLGLARFLAQAAAPAAPAAPASRAGGAALPPAGPRPGAEAAPVLEAGADDDPWAFLPPWAQPTPAPAAALAAEFERLVERLCCASEQAASHDSGRALALASLAFQLAELAPIGASREARLQGYAQAFVANALRVGDDLRAAEAAFAAAWRLWRLGGDAGESFLGEWRLLDLDASLRRDQRRFGPALDLLARALALAPPEAHGRILLKRASILEQAGEFQAALAALAEAAPLLEPAGEPRDRMGVVFNRAVNLCHLGRHREAEASLASLRALAEELGGEPDLRRLRWLEARVAAGLGRRDEALAGLAALQRELTDLGSAYDAALAGLDLAVLYLEEGRTREVATLAGEMAWIFRARDVHREALAALQLFREAAEREVLTLELAERLREYWRRSHHDRRPFVAPRRPRGKPARGGQRPAPGRKR
jgi:transcriptional regulator with XRE-family HTH domain/tetratricopeptide (TPR) repeat protein